MKSWLIVLLEYCMGDETTEYGRERAATATIESGAVKFTMPPLSAGVVRVTP